MNNSSARRRPVSESGCVLQDQTELDCVPELVPGGENFELFTEGDPLYRSMLASIAAAHERIDLENYIFAADEVGWRFAEALASRASRGVAVRLHLDAVGCMFVRSRRIENYLRQHRVQLRWFHRWSWRQPWRYSRRNHRKLLVVDCREAYLGGFNIHRESSRELSGPAAWRDSHVRFYGSLALQAGELFDAFWNGDHEFVPRGAGPQSSILIPNQSHACRRRLRCLYRDIITGAADSIELTTPYFVPDSRMQHALMSAARRGVNVQVLVPRKIDVRVVGWAARAAYANLLNAGVRIYEYLPRMLHAKTMVVDGNWATLGTANVDYRSFFLNYEVNLITRDPALCESLRNQFAIDLGEAEEVVTDRWSKRRWSAHLSEAIGWWARRWL